jgi:aminocarboxymuconate-semialdehyde decarboxylase
MSHRLVVDMHTHFIPATLKEEALRHPSWGVTLQNRDGKAWVVHEQGFAYPFFATFHSVEAKLADMDDRGIDVSVISLSPTLFFYWIDSREAEAFARMANEALADMVAASKGRLVGLASLPMPDPEAAAEELRYSVEELGLLGAQVGSSVEGRDLDLGDFVPFWEAADAFDAPIMLHPYYVGPKPGWEDYYLTNIFGNPLGTAWAASRLIFCGILDRFPNLRLVLVHGGGFLPYQIGRLDHGWKVRPEAKVKLARPPSEYLDRFFFDTITHHDGALAWLVQLVGDDHVMLGSDLPYDMGDVDPVGRLERVIAAGKTKDRIAGDNAAKLFRLKARPAALQARDLT